MRLPWRKTNSTAACWGRRVRPPCGLRVGVASDSEGSGTVRRTAWRDIFMMGDVVSDGVRGVPIATEKKTTIFTGTDVQMVGGAAAGGSGDMDNIILGTSLACAAGVAAAFRADLRALRARERAMRQGAEFSWGPNGHELRVVLPGLRSAEVTAVESGRIEAALLVEPPVLFLLIRFREQTDRVALGLVCSCCWWGSPEERTDPPASEVVRFVLVEGQSGIVRAIRTFSFSLEFTRSFHGAIDEQARLGYDPAHEVAVEAMVRQYSTDQLWHCCQVRCSA